ncbi:CubicO group peptidase, beta-lactamase class C family [Actinopolymorpha cephalotaxi]|uniref:CubicO group peptidase (Beta-lactamase class C family) n=1 Tax=Actinopolymorpha cephalotaxi TaxID=504797 RepID=A0A1I2ZR44_9ACTN|nr:serine hydrolase domain-containing protein [Actinopolymorpha cephalotaxi]NYH84113.1 CubicO group peptidase (beta-lactamase class C family) [Actinopolymorpha cephalotaxi]SFH40170.1 CubicO group peptidase, beta-lactamase class C family [Actinopolymorpha cephalotaxi]
MTNADDLRGQLTADLQRLCTEHEVPGASVAVLVDGEVVEATFGVVNVRTGVPVTPDTLFMIQSITKILTATLAMQLVDAGLVELDDPIHHHLPQFHTADREVSSRVTVRHLLTHTGGFAGDLWAATTSGPDALQRFVEDLVSDAPQYSEPGEQFSYCNAGFGVLGRLVEVKRGVTYEEAVRRYLAEPLAVDELAFSADQALAFRTAIGHVHPKPDSALRPLRHWAVMPPSNPAAGNQLAMSARGLLAVARMHLNDGRSPDGSAVLSEASTRLMRERQVDHPAALGAPSSHGLGWWLQRDRLAEHGGGATGVAAMLRTAPQHGLAAVVLTNAESGGAIVDDLLEPVFAERADLPQAPGLSTPDAGTRVADPHPYLGHFDSRQNRLEVTQLDDGRFWLTTVPQGESLEFAALAGTTATSQAYELRPVNADTFANSFVVIGDTGRATYPVEFLGRDDHDCARFLFFGGRAVPRSD